MSPGKRGVGSNRGVLRGPVPPGDTDEVRRSRRIELVVLCGRLDKERPDLIALIRYVVCCFYEEGGWDPNKEEDSTPIPLYLFLLKRFDPDLGAKLLTYARAYLLSRANIAT